MDDRAQLVGEGGLGGLARLLELEAPDPEATVCEQRIAHPWIGRVERNGRRQEPTRGIGSHRHARDRAYVGKLGRPVTVEAGEAVRSVRIGGGRATGWR